MPIHYDTIEDGQNKTSCRLFSFLVIIVLFVHFFDVIYLEEETLLHGPWKWNVTILEDLFYRKLLSDQASGGSNDYMYAAQGIPYSYGIEGRDTGEYGFLLPAKYIQPSAEENWAALVAVCDYIHNMPSH